jgi:short-subunit dehydrogenase
MALAERAGAQRVGTCSRSGAGRSGSNELARTVDAASGSIATLALDLRTPQAAAKIVRGALAAFGGIDVLVNNAGGVAVGPISRADRRRTRRAGRNARRRTARAHARSAVRAARIAAATCSSWAAASRACRSGLLGAYPPVKAAVRNLTRIVRNELRGDGIAVTYVDPGAVATEFMTRAGFAGPPPALAATPQQVARRIFDAFETRKPVVNAVPWQTFAVAIGEAFPGVTDFILRRAPQIVLGDGPLPVAATTDAATLVPNAAPKAETATASLAALMAPPDPLEAALAAQATRMHKLNMKMSYVRSLLVPNRELRTRRRGARLGRHAEQKRTRAHERRARRARRAAVFSNTCSPSATASSPSRRGGGGRGLAPGFAGRGCPRQSGVAVPIRAPTSHVIRVIEHSFP